VSDANKQELNKSFDDILQIHKADKKMDMQFILEEPNSQEKNLMNVLINLFNKARHSIKIVTPYFLPTEGLASALTTAA
jgi:cardiolipin synthase